MVRFVCPPDSGASLTSSQSQIVDDSLGQPLLSFDVLWLIVNDGCRHGLSASSPLPCSLAPSCFGGKDDHSTFAEQYVLESFGAVRFAEAASDLTGCMVYCPLEALGSPE